MRVALIADFVEEGWPSMDLVAERLASALSERTDVAPFFVRPPLRRRLGWVPGVNGRPITAERIVARFWDYPRWLRRHLTDADVFHVIDHSYAHLAHELPAARVVVTCHDTDAFRSILDGSRESKLPRALSRRVASGIGRAAAVACVSHETKRALVATGLVPAGRAFVVGNGADPECSPRPDPDADRAVSRYLGPPHEHEDLLHVGSVIRRKRIDVLLHVLARVAARRPRVRLVRAGGPLTREQARLASDLGVSGRIISLPFLARQELAAVYRRAALLLQPSEREGFGLPVVEAMASGTPVVANDLPVFHEIGGRAATYVPIGDVGRWAETIDRLLDERATDPASWQARRHAGLAHAPSFSWHEVADRMVHIYRRLA